jgi:hypothetical protein
MPEADILPRNIIALFDHLVGAAEQWEREFDSERFGSLQVNREMQPVHRQSLPETA